MPSSYFSVKRKSDTLQVRVVIGSKLSSERGLIYLGIGLFDCPPRTVGVVQGVETAGGDVDAHVYGESERRHLQRLLVSLPPAKLQGILKETNKGNSNICIMQSSHFI